MRYYIECAMRSGPIVRMLFATRRKAENARRKIAAAMEKGQFRNSDYTVEVKSDASNYTLLAAEILTVAVNDSDLWIENAAERKRKAQDLGVSEAIVE